MERKISPPYKTVITLQDLEFGGTQRYAVHLLKHLNRDLFDTELWVLRGGEDMLPLAQASGLPIKYLSRNSWVTPQALWKFFWRLKRHRPDVLYTMTGVPNIWGRVFGALALDSVMVTSWRGLRERQLESFLWKFSDLLICNANALREFVIKRHRVDPQIVVVVPNGVDTDFFTPDPSCRAGCPTVVFVGRLVKEKDPLCLIEAFALLRNIVPETRMVMVGQGYMQSSVQRQLVSTGLSEHVELVPGANDVRPFLRKAWTLVLPSVSEGFPQVILEAMACGLPVVASATGGIPEIVEDGVTGLLVPPRSPKSLAQSLAKILSDDQARIAMAKRAREKVEQSYSLEHVVRMTEKYILEAIRRKRSA